MCYTSSILPNFYSINLQHSSCKQLLKLDDELGFQKLINPDSAEQGLNQMTVPLEIYYFFPNSEKNPNLKGENLLTIHYQLFNASYFSFYLMAMYISKAIGCNFQFFITTLVPEDCFYL